MITGLKFLLVICVPCIITLVMAAGLACLGDVGKYGLGVVVYFLVGIITGYRFWRGDGVFYYLGFVPAINLMCVYVMLMFKLADMLSVDKKFIG